MKKIIAVFIAMFMFLIVHVHASESFIILKINDSNAVVNGYMVKIDPDDHDVMPYIDSNNRTMLPLRFVSEYFDSDVTWDPVSGIIGVLNNGNHSIFNVSSKEVIINGETVMMDTQPVIKNNRTFIPIRFLSENVLGKRVEWNEKARLVAIHASDSVYLSNDKNLNSFINNTQASHTATFIDLFPVKSYNLNNTTYVSANDLTNYGFVLESSTDTELRLSFDINKEFVPLETSEINIKKSQASSLDATTLVESLKKVYLDGKQISAYSIGENLVVPITALSAFGTVDINNVKGTIYITYNRAQASSENGRVVFSESSDFEYAHRNEMYRCIKSSSFNNSYSNSNLDGYCIETTIFEGMDILARLYYKDSRYEGYYKNGVKDGSWRECIIDDDYLYGYRVVWEGSYRNGDRLYYEVDKAHQQSDFASVMSGSNELGDFVIFQKSDGSYYGIGNHFLHENYPYYLWPNNFEGASLDGIVLIEPPFESYNIYTDINSPERLHYINDKNQLVNKAENKIIAEQVSAIFSEGSEYSLFNYGRTLILKKDGSLWFSRLNGMTVLDEAKGFITSYVDGLDLSEPVKIMDDVVDCAVTGSCTYFAIKKDGSLWSFGANSFGQAGIGSFGEEPTIATLDDSSLFEPIKILDDVADVVAGSIHGIALKKDGSLYGWGDNSDAQLGLGDLQARTRPTKIMDDVASIAAPSHVVKKDGTIWHWGRNLWDGTVMTEPVQITDVYRYATGNFLE